MRGAIHAGPGLGVWHRSHGAPWRTGFHIFNCAIIFSWAARAPLGKTSWWYKHNAKRAGLVVDTLFGATQTVINPWLISSRMFLEFPARPSWVTPGGVDSRCAGLLHSFELETVDAYSP